jgi:hypothetical protein
VDLFINQRYPFIIYYHSYHYENFYLLYSIGITLIVCVGMSMIGNDDVGLEVAAVVAIEVNLRVRWNAGQI